MKKILKWTFFSIAGLFVLLCAAIILMPEKPYTPYQPSEDYLRQLETFHVPPAPDGWRWHVHTARDGTRLRAGFAPRHTSAKAEILILPGFTGTIEQYFEHINYWHTLGYNVSALDHRGQGGSDRPLADFPERPYIEDFYTYSEDLNGFIAKAYREGGPPLILAGSSMGGHVAYRTMAEFAPKQVKGLLLAAPAFRPNTPPYPYKTAKNLVGFLKFLGRGASYGVGQKDWQPDVADLTETIRCSAAPKRVYVRDAVYAKHPNLRSGTATNQWLWAFMSSGEIAATPDYAQKISVPAHFMIAENDQVIVNSVSEQVCNDMSDCTIYPLKGSGHCIPQETDIQVEKWYQAMEDLLVKISPK